MTPAVKAMRNGEVHEFNVTLGEFTAEALSRTSVTTGLQTLSRYGVSFTDRRGPLRLTQSPVIKRVDPDSPASEAGFRTGQIVLQVGDQAVHSIEEVCTAAAEQGLLLGRRLRFTVADVDSAQAGAPKTIEVQALK